MLDALEALQLQRDSVIAIGAQGYFVAVSTERIATRMSELVADVFAGPATQQSLHYLATLFTRSNATGSAMAGRAEEGIGDPAIVAASVTALATDLLHAMTVPR